MNQSFMTRYFTNNYMEEIENLPVKTGYFIGMRMIQELFNKGISLLELTRMDSDAIITLLNK